MAKLVHPSDLTAHPKLGTTELLPALTDAEYTGLRDSIRDFGIMQPLVVAWPEKVILDGHHRWRIAQELGLETVPIQTEEFRKAPDQLRLGVELNAHRRHLTTDQKRAAIAALLTEDPKQSDRSVAAAVGASPTTVGSVRSDLEEKGAVSNLDTRVGRDGVEQPATKPKPGPLATPTTKPTAKPAPRDPAEQAKSVAADARREFDAGVVARVNRYVLGLPTLPAFDDGELASVAGSLFDERGTELRTLEAHHAFIDSVIRHVRRGGVRVVR